MTLEVRLQDGRSVPTTADGKAILDFGVVEVGSKVRKTWLLCNNYEGEVSNIEVIVSDPNVKVVEVPDRIPPGRCAKLTLEYEPPLKLKRGLKAKVAITYVVGW